MRIQEGFDGIERISIQDGTVPIYFDPRMTLMFICECADENCTRRIKMRLNEYNAIHRSPKRFVIAKGHNAPDIENVIETKKNYFVVEKNETPPQDVDKLNKTDFDSQST